MFDTNWKQAARIVAEPHDNYAGVYLNIEDDRGGRYTFWLDPGLCRALHREGARALGFGQIPRKHRQHAMTRLAVVNQRIEPILVLASALFPKPKPVKKAAS